MKGIAYKCEVIIEKVREMLKQRLKSDSILYKGLKIPSAVVGKCSPWVLGKASVVMGGVTRNSIFATTRELHMCSLFPQKTLDETIAIFAPTSVLDIGCGSGVSMDYFLSKGIDAVGVEGSTMAISNARNSKQIVQFDLRRELDLNRRFDLVWSYEFVEHIHPRYVTNLARSFSNHADRLVLSAAPPGQTGLGHFNEQPSSYWIEKFADLGYSYNERAAERLRATGEVYSQSMLVFER